MGIDKRNKELIIKASSIIKKTIEVSFKLHFMRKILIIFYLLLLSINSIGQNSDAIKFTPPSMIADTLNYDSVLSKFDKIKDSVTTKYTLDGVDEFGQLPSFPGGEEALYHFLTDNLNYPDSSKKAGIHGTVYTVFIVDTNGNLTNIKIFKGLSYDIDKEVIRVISIMPKWIPYMSSYNHHKHNVQMVLPIQFYLTNDKDKKSKKRKI